jgi:hypothetical protein
MIVSTTKCEEFGHREFALEADESSVPDIYLGEMAETIEHMVANGSVFRPGQTFQVSGPEGHPRVCDLSGRDGGCCGLHKPTVDPSRRRAAWHCPWQLS